MTTPRPMTAIVGLCLATVCGWSGTAAAQEDLGEPTVHRVTEPVDAVVLYQGRAQVTRTAELGLAPDYYQVEFAGLPESLEPESLQARVTGGRLMDVQFKEVPSASRLGSPEWAALKKEADGIEAKIRELHSARAGIEFGSKYLDRLLAESAQGKSDEAGKAAFDIEAATKQLEFVAVARGTIFQQLQQNELEVKAATESLSAVQRKMAAMGGGQFVDRLAVVSLVVVEQGEVSVSLQHLVNDASWTPTYAIRANRVPGAITLEYDAVIMQSTGESWDKVAMTLSTAEPSTAANPPVVRPVYVDVSVPPPPAAMAPAEMVADRFDRSEGGTLGDAGGRAGGYALGVRKKSLERASSAAAVDSTGTAVTFALPRAVTVPSDGNSSQTTRITTIDCEPKFVHAAQPVVAEGVYLRGDAKNASQFLLLAGEARIFLDGDFIGPTAMVEVPSGAEFEVFFGIDPNVTATRTVVSSKTETSGLFGGTKDTKIRYRIDLQNASANAVTLEVWDRMPVSRNDEIKVKLVDASAPLATDAEYTDLAKKQGILKWVLLLAAAAAEGPAKSVLTWGVDVSRGDKVQTTPIPQ